MFEVIHTTQFSYEAPVTRCLNQVHLTPRTFPGQTVYQSTLVIDPAPATFQHRKDYFGNDTATFAVIEQHDKLTATATSLVKVEKRPLIPKSSLSWEEARDQISAAADDSCLEASEFIYSSPFVPALKDLAPFAAVSFKPGCSLLAAASDLSQRIYKEFKYDPKATSIEAPLGDVLRNKHGVCQDFAHLMIGACRSLRLAARYVSGYVKSGPKVQGAQASHAWVSVFVPEIGWVAFDPTNNVMPAENHVTLAWGRDYGDVTPVKGVTLGGGLQTVEVEVYVNLVQ